MMKWINVKDRLPEEKEEQFSDFVLVYDSCGEYWVSYYDFLNKIWNDYDDFPEEIEVDFYVTHWRPLPKPPKKYKP